MSMDMKNDTKTGVWHENGQDLDIRADFPQRWSPTTTTLTSLSSIITSHSQLIFWLAYHRLLLLFLLFLFFLFGFKAEIFHFYESAFICLYFLLKCTTEMIDEETL